MEEPNRTDIGKLRFVQECLDAGAVPHAKEVIKSIDGANVRERAQKLLDEHVSPRR